MALSETEQRAVRKYSKRDLLLRVKGPLHSFGTTPKAYEAEPQQPKAETFLTQTLNTKVTRETFVHEGGRIVGKAALAAGALNYGIKFDHDFRNGVEIPFPGRTEPPETPIPEEDFEVAYDRLQNMLEGKAVYEPAPEAVAKGKIINTSSPYVIEYPNPYKNGPLKKIEFFSHREGDSEKTLKQYGEHGLDEADMDLDNVTGLFGEVYCGHRAQLSIPGLGITYGAYDRSSGRAWINNKSRTYEETMELAKIYGIKTFFAELKRGEWTRDAIRSIFQDSLDAGISVILHSIDVREIGEEREDTVMMATEVLKEFEQKFEEAGLNARVLAIPMSGKAWDEVESKGYGVLTDQASANKHLAYLQDKYFVIGVIKDPSEITLAQKSGASAVLGDAGLILSRLRIAEEAA